MYGLEVQFNQDDPVVQPVVVVINGDAVNQVVGLNVGLAFVMNDSKMMTAKLPSFTTNARPTLVPTTWFTASPLITTATGCTKGSYWSIELPDEG